MLVDASLAFIMDQVSGENNQGSEEASGSVWEPQEQNQQPSEAPPVSIIRGAQGLLNRTNDVSPLSNLALICRM